MRRKIFKNIFNYTLIICFVTFIVLFTSSKTGYTEYQNHKQAVLTERQIKKFESDVNKGKQIDVEKYLKINNPNYQNKLSKIGLEISNTTGDAVKMVVKTSFKFLSKLDE